MYSLMAADGQVRIGIIVLDEFDNSVYGRIAVFSFVERIIILVDCPEPENLRAV